MKKTTILICILFTIGSAYAQRFKVTYDARAFKGPFTGHVILFLSKTNPEPRTTSDSSCYGMQVEFVAPGQIIAIGNEASYFPVPLTSLERGTYYAQAVWDRDLGGRAIGTSPGNPYNKAVKVELTGDTNQVISLNCNDIIPSMAFRETRYVKELIVPSKLLTRFSGREETVNAAIILPQQYYTEPERKFPIVFMFGGYGGNYHHYSAENGDTMPSIPLNSTPCIKVFLDGDCRLGHSVYANSDNTGPWGDAFTKEFIPALQKQYRSNGALLMKGHSSGGWTVLWLQLRYPKLFAGCNASAPDPVDFRSFVNVNLYDKAPKKVAPHAEDVLYRGEQDRSFDAVFGPRSDDGRILTLYDAATGAMNTDVLEHWKKYDINIFLQKNWKKLEADLKGKIRISVGNEDTYFLNKSVEKLDEEMKKMNTGIVFAYYPGDHFSVATPAYKKDETKWLEEKYLEWEMKKK
jgi:pimeloyl-ACP methyl ester carboxylesterase